MPQQDWAGTLRNVLGLKLPEAGPEPTAEQTKRHYDDVDLRNQQYRNENPIKSKAWDWAGAGVDALMGFTGLEDKPDNKANMFGQLAEAATDLVPGKAAAKMLAGLPFASYPYKKLLHGTPEPFDYIEPDKLREGTHGMKFFGTPDPGMSNEFAEQFGRNEGRAATIPFVPKANNILDLIDPDPVDLHKIIRTMPDAEQLVHMDILNQMVREGKSNREAYRMLAPTLRVPSGAAEKLGFDGVRYKYGGSEAFGFPESTPIESAYGGALNIAAGPKKAFNQPPVTYKPKAKPDTSKPTVTTVKDVSSLPEVGVTPSGKRVTREPKIKEPKAKDLQAYDNTTLKYIQAQEQSNPDIVRKTSEPTPEAPRERPTALSTPGALPSEKFAASRDELDARNADDLEYRNLFSTAAKNPLKPGETWRSRVERAIEYFKKKESASAPTAIEAPVNMAPRLIKK